jgi:hypothetical protein
MFTQALPQLHGIMAVDHHQPWCGVTQDDLNRTTTLRATNFGMLDSQRVA